MAVRPPDFKSSGIRAERIIASGSSSNPRLLLIGSGAAGNDGVNVDTNNLRLAGTGSDTWLFISGAVGGNDRVTFGGDVHISGTLSGVTVGAVGSDTQVQFNDAGSFGASSGFVYNKSNQTLTVGNLTVTGTLTSISSSQVRIVDPVIILGSGSSGGLPNANGGIAIASGSSTTGQALVWGRIANDTWGAGRLDVQDGTLSNLTSMNLVNVRAAKLEVRNSSNFISSSAAANLLVNAASQVLVMSGGGPTSPNPLNYADTNFFVSGTVGSKGTATLGTAVFGGDTLASGSIYSLSIISASGDLLAGGNLTVNNNATVLGDLTVNGGDLLTTSTSVAMFPINATSITLGGNTTSVSIGNSGIGTSHTFTVASARTGDVTINLANGTAAGGSTKNINIGQGGVAGSTTNIRLGTTDDAGVTNIFISGSMQMTGSVDIRGSIVPNADFTYNLGTPTLRWQNVYTGDLHLRNSRGDWTILEEEDYLCVINNKTGKKYKMMLQPLD